MRFVRVGSLALSAGVLSPWLSKRGIVLTLGTGDQSLLNADYKIASRTIAPRLHKVIHLIVNKDQTCGVPGRFIGENVAFLRDVVDFCISSGVPAALFSLDQEKALDRVDWSFLRSTLYALGFGQSFVGSVDLFYNNSCSAVQ